MNYAFGMIPGNSWCTYMKVKVWSVYGIQSRSPKLPEFAARKIRKVIGTVNVLHETRQVAEATRELDRTNVVGCVVVDVEVIGC